MRRVVLSLILLVSVAAAAEAARVEVRDEWLYVEGEPFLVKGIGYSPYRPGQSPWATKSLDPELMRADFARIKQAGFNTIRTWTPLGPDQLALAQQYQLMVLQGIRIDPNGDHGSDAFREAIVDLVRKETERGSAQSNVLAYLVGNELSPVKVFRSGVASTEASLRAAANAVKSTNQSRLASYANWPALSFLDASMWDIVSFNLYPYEPASVAHTFGYRGYVRYLRQSVARGKPLIITEVGLSVSPTAGDHPGYGGHTPDAQARQLVRLVDDVVQAGASGSCVFEWSDEWWKQGEPAGDEATHDSTDPEEWFGINEYPSDNPTALVPRPAYDALKTYNQAILISPVDDALYAGQVPVSVYTTDEVASVRVRLGKQKWRAAVRVSPHWWKVQWPLAPAQADTSIRLTMEARNKAGQVLVQRERMLRLGQTGPSAVMRITTEQNAYEVGSQMQPVRFTITVAQPDGSPVANQPVRLSIQEPVNKFELTHVKETDPQGTLVVTYPVWDTGFVVLAASTDDGSGQSGRRIGTEHLVTIERTKEVAPTRATGPAHQPSVWEQQATPDIRKALEHGEPLFRLYDPGTETVVDYTRFGTFSGLGTARYHYAITDRSGLAAAVGEGIFPNEEGLTHDPAYRRALENNDLSGNIWDFTYSDNVQLAFLKWAGSAEEAPGVKQFFIGMTLERAGLLQQAVKAYYAVLVHYPDAVGWTEFKTPWYVAKVARDKIDALLRIHPELGLRLEGASIVVEHGFDNAIDNDVVIANPGRLVHVLPEAVNPPTLDLSQMPVQREIGKGRIVLRQYANRHWQLLVDGKPWVIRGISYSPTAVGESPDEGTQKDWMTADRNQNGKPDAPFDTFVDANGNNRQDPDEPTVGDFQLLKEMGVNTLRLYHHATNKALLRQLYDEQGIMVMMGDLVGMYTIGSGAKWEAGTDYLDPVQRKRMAESVQEMVREYKKEPYVLMWVLGNENNYGGVHGIIGGVGNAAEHPQEYYEFLNELAELIHKEDPNHPVGIANGEWLFLDVIEKAAPAIDVFGANVYRGAHGFGRSFFEAVRDHLDKPVLITEYGCPAYQANRSLEEGELGQALYHFGNWVDLADNLAGRGVGNALGGVVFAFVDEWWKAGQPPRFSPKVHETAANWSGPFPGGKMYEEWLGVTSQGDGNSSPYLRQLRKAYRVYQQLWNRQ